MAARCVAQNMVFSNVPSIQMDVTIKSENRNQSCFQVLLIE